MADRRPRTRDTGFDVWIPALVALLAALFMVVTARAEDAPVPVAAPQPLFNAQRFEDSAMDREAAAIAVARGVYAEEAAAPEPRLRHLKLGTVIVSALPEMHPITAAEALRSVVTGPSLSERSASVANPPARGDASVRLLVSLGIAALLAGALVVLYRVWRRTERPPSV